MIYYPNLRYNPYINIKPYEEIVRAYDTVPLEDETVKFAIVLLYGTMNKLYNARSLAWHTNVSFKICAIAVRNLKKGKIWIQKGKKFKQEFSSSKKPLEMILAFWLAEGVAKGTLIKRGGYYGLSEWEKDRSFSQKYKARMRYKQLQKMNTITI